MNKQPMILIVDDDESFRALTRSLLSNSGCQIAEAHDGLAAAQYLRDHPVDLMISDLVMPERDGVELIRQTRSAKPGMKIIAVSGAIAKTHYLRAVSKLGADVVIDKADVRDRLAAEVN